MTEHGHFISCTVKHSSLRGMFADLPDTLERELNLTDFPNPLRLLTVPQYENALHSKPLLRKVRLLNLTVDKSLSPFYGQITEWF